MLVAALNAWLLIHSRLESSAAGRCRKTDLLSVVRKSRNSSGGLYRCRRHSANDRRRTNALRFLMNTLLAHPIPRLIQAFPANPLWIRSALAAVSVSPAKPRSRQPRLLAWQNYNSQSFGASSILLFKAAGTAIYASKIAPCPRLRPIAHGTFPRAEQPQG